MLKNIIKRNSYYDSVTLMLISKKLVEQSEVINASAMMGSKHNKDLMLSSGLLDEEGLQAGPNDLIIAIESEEEAISKALMLIDEFLTNRVKTEKCTNMPKTIDAATRENKELNLAVISVPGEYATLEAKKALDHGMNVFLFSDHVTVEEELFLKEYADQKNLLVMGPDCGTSIINGVGIGFANKVQRGNVGIVSASGTGVQEITCLLDAKGIGISHAIGTGGRDLSKEVRAITMKNALRLLQNDDDTEIIIVVSKPPHPEAVQELNSIFSKIKKPIIICFLDGESKQGTDGLYYAANLEEATSITLKILGREKAITDFSLNDLEPLAKSEADKLTGDQEYLRALYTGGTLCYEAMLVAREVISNIYSNIHLAGTELLKDNNRSHCNTFLDMGDDFFTTGRPHPMIDPEERIIKFKQEANLPETAVILLDFVLGYGGHSDPCGILADVIKEEKKKASDKGKYLSVIASVCGTESDVPKRSEQIKKLQDADVVVMGSNAKAALLAAKIVSLKKGGDENKQ